MIEEKPRFPIPLAATLVSVAGFTGFSFAASNVRVIDAAALVGSQGLRVASNSMFLISVPFGVTM